MDLNELMRTIGQYGQSQGLSGLMDVPNVQQGPQGPTNYMQGFGPTSNPRQYQSSMGVMEDDKTLEDILRKLMMTDYSHQLGYHPSIMSRQQLRFPYQMDEQNQMQYNLKRKRSYGDM